MKRRSGAIAWDSEPVRRRTERAYILGRGGALGLFAAPRRKNRGSEKTELCSRGTLNPRLEQQGEALLLCRGETLGICTAPPRIFGVQSHEATHNKRMARTPDGVRAILLWCESGIALRTFAPRKRGIFCRFYFVFDFSCILSSWFYSFGRTISEVECYDDFVGIQEHFSDERAHKHLPDGVVFGIFINVFVKVGFNLLDRQIGVRADVLHAGSYRRQTLAQHDVQQTVHPLIPYRVPRTQTIENDPFERFLQGRVATRRKMIARNTTFQ